MNFYLLVCTHENLTRLFWQVTITCAEWVILAAAEFIHARIKLSNLLLILAGYLFPNIIQCKATACATSAQVITITLPALYHNLLCK